MLEFPMIFGGLEEIRRVEWSVKGIRVEGSVLEHAFIVLRSLPHEPLVASFLQCQFVFKHINILRQQESLFKGKREGLGCHGTGRRLNVWSRMLFQKFSPGTIQNLGLTCRIPQFKFKKIKCLPMPESPQTPSHGTATIHSIQLKQCNVSCTLQLPWLSSEVLHTRTKEVKCTCCPDVKLSTASPLRSCSIVGD